MPILDPGAGYLTQALYVNASFGYALPIPAGFSVAGEPGPIDSTSYLMITLQAVQGPSAAFGTRGRVVSPLSNAHVTALSASSRKAKGESPDDLKQYLERIGFSNVTPATISNHSFMKGSKQQITGPSKIDLVSWVTVQQGYLLQFTITAFDPKSLPAATAAVETMQFFPPDQAKAAAGPDSYPYGTVGADGALQLPR